jgi:hypothetical protein
MDRRQFVALVTAALAAGGRYQPEPDKPDYIGYWLIRLNKAMGEDELIFYAKKLREAIEAESVPAKYTKAHGLLNTLLDREAIPSPP